MVLGAVAAGSRVDFFPVVASRRKITDVKFGFVNFFQAPKNANQGPNLFASKCDNPKLPLKNNSYKILEAIDGVDALEMVKKNKLDLVLCDIPEHIETSVLPAISDHMMVLTKLYSSLPISSP